MTASYDADDVAKWARRIIKYHSALYAAAKRDLTNELSQGISLQSDRYVWMHLNVMQQLEAVTDEHHKFPLFIFGGAFANCGAEIAKGWADFMPILERKAANSG